MRRLTAGFGLLACVAWADIPPRNTSSCREAPVGAACKTDDGQNGTCVTSTCSRKKYEKGQPLKHVEVECLRCEVAHPDAGTK